MTDPGVSVDVVHHARWQDVVETLGQFDGIFFDTYGEYYSDMQEFHGKLLHWCFSVG